MIEFGQLVLEKKIFKNFQCILLFSYYLPLEKDNPLHLNNLESPPKDDLCQLRLKLVCWFWRRRFVFHINMLIWFSLLWPLLTPGDHDVNNSESTLYQKAFMQIWPILARWFWRRRFLDDPTPFFHFCDYLPFEEDLALYLNNLESPLPKDDLCQVWLKLAGWFWRRRFLTRCVYETQMPPRVTNSIESHAYIKAFEK